MRRARLRGEKGWQDKCEIVGNHDISRPSILLIYILYRLPPTSRCRRAPSKRLFSTFVYIRLVFFILFFFTSTLMDHKEHTFIYAHDAWVNRSVLYRKCRRRIIKETKNKNKKKPLFRQSLFSTAGRDPGPVDRNNITF